VSAISFTVPGRPLTWKRTNTVNGRRLTDAKTWNAVETRSPLTKIGFRDGEAFPRIVDMAKQPPRVLRRVKAA